MRILIPAGSSFARRRDTYTSIAFGDRSSPQPATAWMMASLEKIVSKEAIIQAVAGWGDDLSPNAIEVYISRLRSKLEPAGIKIRTVRGFGYMLEEFKEP